MSPYTLGHMMLGVTVAATRNDLFSAQSWQGQPGPIATAPMPVDVCPYRVGVSTLPETIKQLANSHLRLMPMRLASGRVKA